MVRWQPSDDNSPLLLYDGVCGLCNRAVQFVSKRNRSIRFAPLQSALARQLLKRHDIEPDALDTVVFIEGDRAYTHSDAVIHLAPHLEGGGRWLAWLRALPRPIRDAGYRWIARHRYGWFGKLDQCQLPSPAEASRFLAMDEDASNNTS